MIDIEVKGFEDVLGNFGEILSPRKVAQMVSREILPVIETRLTSFAAQTPPPRSSTKFVWSFNRAANLRARRWWFRQLKLGNINTDGSHYTRSGNIPNAWRTDLVFSQGAIVLSLLNEAPGSQYVYGSPEQTQVPGHASTGWFNYKELETFFGVVDNELVIAWEELVLSSIKRKR